MDDVQASADQRERMAMSVERLNQSSDKIMESRRTMLETEEIGVSILQDLHQQRETLLHSHQKVYFLHDIIFFTCGSLWLKLEFSPIFLFVKWDSISKPLLYVICALWRTNA